MTKIDISEKLIQERLKLNFSVVEVGELAHYTRAYINRIEFKANQTKFLVKLQIPQTR